MNAYSLEDFLNDCKLNKNLVNIDDDAQDDAIHVLHITAGTKEKIKHQILDIISSHDIKDFDYKNTAPFRKGINGDHPLVDAYVFMHGFINIYISFCIVKTNNGWFIKSIHSDGSHDGHGDSMSIGEMMKLKLIRKN